ncbi:MAG: ATP-grasp domain-containing protein, partial [Phycisphaerales bacterium]
MKVHEYQARQLLHDAGIAVPPGAMVETVDDAAREAKRIFDSGAGLAVVKAQVHAGGRGKAGFVKLVKDASAATEAAGFMLSNRMKSPQTPPEGLEVNRLLVAEAVDIAKEFYLAILVDRARRTNTLIASAEGGVEIEKTAEERPEAILTMPTHPALGLQPFQAREVAFRLDDLDILVVDLRPPVVRRRLVAPLAQGEVLRVAQPRVGARAAVERVVASAAVH